MFYRHHRHSENQCVFFNNKKKIARVFFSKRFQLKIFFDEFTSSLISRIKFDRDVDKSIELVKTEILDARYDEERKKNEKTKKKKQKEKETSTHIRIKKELYICALTNLPRTTHIMTASQTYSIFHLFLFFMAFFSSRNRERRVLLVNIELILFNIISLI